MSGPYRQRILAHAKAPHNRGVLDPCHAEATVHNPLCGDRVTVHLQLDDDRIQGARFEARGCAIAIASASILTDAVASSTTTTAGHLSARVIEAVDTGVVPTDFDEELRAVASVHTTRARRRCATLAWEALLAALV